jgi:Na+/proline symporter
MNQQYLPYIILGVIAAYFLILGGVSYLTTKNSSDNDTFFLANRKAPWYLVTIGLIGASISGVTFISIPGKVAVQNFAYFQLVLGYVVGYAIIALVLLPLYYRMNLVSIYTYLEERFGFEAYRSGAILFLVSRTIGSALRMFLMVNVLQIFALDYFHVPITLTAFLCVGLVWFYTLKGGTKTILYTDVILTFCFIGAVIVTIGMISSRMEMSTWDMFSTVWNSEKSKIFYFKDAWADPNNFFKQFISGMLITVVMTGLDQDLMQKNLACKNIKEAQKNMFTFSGVLALVNLLFLFLGAFLILGANINGWQIPTQTDQIYPTIAFKELGQFSAVIFTIGIVGSTFSSSDSALTALTTSVCVDFFNFNKKIDQVNPAKYDYDDAKVAEAKIKVSKDLQQLRFKIHTGVALVLFWVVMIIANFFNDKAIIDNLLKSAGFTYGPLLGLFAFGIGTTRKIENKFVYVICILSPILTYLLDAFLIANNIKMSFLVLLFNGIFTFGALYLTSKPAPTEIVGDADFKI